MLRRRALQSSSPCLLHHTPLSALQLQRVQRRSYDTFFHGEFAISPPLADAHREYLTAFSYSFRLQRDPKESEKYEDPVRRAVGLPLGEDSCYYVGYDFRDPRVPINHVYRPPKGQPQLWCKWVPSKNGASLRWNQRENFVGYVVWLQYLIDHFFTPWDYKLNGKVEWLCEYDQAQRTLEQKMIDQGLSEKERRRMVAHRAPVDSGSIEIINNQIVRPKEGSWYAFGYWDPDKFEATNSDPITIPLMK